MAYPTTLPYSMGSQRVIQSGVEIEVATDGTVRARRLFGADLYEFRLVHFGIDGTAKAGLVSNYETNRVAVQTYTWPEDSANYNVYFAQPPLITGLGGDYYSAEVVLLGSAA